jgi:hypothetical protein
MTYEGFIYGVETVVLVGGSLGIIRNWYRNKISRNKRKRFSGTRYYLPTSDKKILEPDITKYEPKTALYSGKDGLDLIKKLLRQIARHATEWGYEQVSILLEYDPPQTKTLLAEIHHLFPQTPHKK